MQCPSCGSRDIDFDDAGGKAVCTQCSAVIEENTIVSSIEFSESGGSSSVIGQFVSATCTKPYSHKSARGRYSSSRDSRDATLASRKPSLHFCWLGLHICGLGSHEASRRIITNKNYSFV